MWFSGKALTQHIRGRGFNPQTAHKQITVPPDRCTIPVPLSLALPAALLTFHHPLPLFCLGLWYLTTPLPRTHFSGDKVALHFNFQWKHSLTREVFPPALPKQACLCSALPPHSGKYIFHDFSFMLYVTYANQQVDKD